jgi:hypothetical protein
VNEARRVAPVVDAFHARAMGKLLLCLGWTGLALASAAELKTTGGGVEVGAGSLGSFTLTYPEFEPARKVIEVKAAGANATVRYEGGTECAISVTKDEIGLSFQSVPAGVKSWKMSMLIDIGFAKGGTWQIADKEGSFPAEKATPPQIASLNGTTFTLKNAQGQSLSFTTPDYAFQQITDNREWNWAIYNWQFIVPCNTDQPTAKIKVTTDLASVSNSSIRSAKASKTAFRTSSRASKTSRPMSKPTRPTTRASKHRSWTASAACRAVVNRWG